jgi:hypothetical protein
MSTHDDRDRGGLITAFDVINAYGWRFYRAARAQRRHRTDPLGRPCWLPEQWEVLIMELAREQEGGDTR